MEEKKRKAANSVEESPLIFFLRLFSCVMFVFCFVYSVFCTVLCIVSPFIYSCLFTIFVQVYRPLPPGGNPVAVKYVYHSIAYNIKQELKYISRG